MIDIEIRKELNDNFLTREFMTHLENYENNERPKLINSYEKVSIERIKIILNNLILKSQDILLNRYIKDEYKYFIEKILIKYIEELNERELL